MPAPILMPDPPPSDGTVVLRPWVESDLDELLTCFEDPTISHWLPMIPYPYTKADARAWFATLEPRRAAGSGVGFAIAGAADEALLGGIALRPDDERRAEVGYWVRSEQRAGGSRPGRCVSSHDARSPSSGSRGSSSTPTWPTWRRSGSRSGPGIPAKACCVRGSRCKASRATTCSTPSSRRSAGPTRSARSTCLGRPRGRRGAARDPAGRRRRRSPGALAPSRPPTPPLCRRSAATPAPVAGSRRLAVAVVLGPNVLELGPVGEIGALRAGQGHDGHSGDGHTRQACLASCRSSRDSLPCGAGGVGVAVAASRSSSPSSPGRRVRSPCGDMVATGRPRPERRLARRATRRSRGRSRRTSSSTASARSRHRCRTPRPLRRHPAASSSSAGSQQRIPRPTRCAS